MAIATGVARPLVKREGWNVKSVGSWLVPFALGAAGGSLVTGGLLALAATTIRLPGHLASQLAIAGASSVIVIDVLLSRQYSVLSLPRQTCSTWFRRWSATRTFLIWGVDLGLGFSTFRVSALYWVVVIWAAAALGSFDAPVAMLAYALGVTSGVVVAVSVDREATAAAIRDRLYASLPRVRIWSNAVAVAVAVSLFIERKPW